MVVFIIFFHHFGEPQKEFFVSGLLAQLILQLLSIFVHSRLVGKLLVHLQFLEELKLLVLLLCVEVRLMQVFLATTVVQL